MDLDNFTTSELIGLYTEIETLLQNHNVIQTCDILEEFSKFFIINYFSQMSDFPDLKAAPEGLQYYNALDENKNRYKIIPSEKDSEIILFESEEIDFDSENKFDHLLVTCFNKLFEINRVFFLNWEHFLQLIKRNESSDYWYIILDKNFVNSVDLIYERSTIQESSISTVKKSNKKDTSQDKSYSVEEKRETDRNAYEPWTVENDQKLKMLYLEDKTIKELCLIFGRSEGGIRSRLKRLGLI